MEIFIDKKYAKNKNVKEIVQSTDIFPKEEPVFKIDPTIVYILDNDIMNCVYLPFFGYVSHYMGEPFDKAQYLKVLNISVFKALFAQFGDFSTERIPELKKNIIVLLYESIRLSHNKLSEVHYCIGLRDFFTISIDQTLDIKEKYSKNVEFESLLYWTANTMVDATFLTILETNCDNVTSLIKSSFFFNKITYLEYIQHSKLRFEIAELVAHSIKAPKNVKLTKYHQTNANKHNMHIYKILPKTIEISSVDKKNGESRLCFHEELYYNLKNAFKFKEHNHF